LRVSTQWYYRRCQNQNRCQSQKFCHDENILDPLDKKFFPQKYSLFLEARFDTDQLMSDTGHIFCFDSQIGSPIDWTRLAPDVSMQECKEV
jgi:hypothetical protein